MGLFLLFFHESQPLYFRDAKRYKAKLEDVEEKRSLSER